MLRELELYSCSILAKFHLPCLTSSLLGIVTPSLVFVLLGWIHSWPSGVCYYRFRHPSGYQKTYRRASVSGALSRSLPLVYVQRSNSRTPGRLLLQGNAVMPQKDDSFRQLFWPNRSTANRRILSETHLNVVNSPCRDS